MDRIQIREIRIRIRGSGSLGNFYGSGTLVDTVTYTETGTAYSDTWHLQAVLWIRNY
jgi:hypothetical protein